VTAYAIAALKFTDRDAHNRYQAAFMEVLMSFPDEKAVRNRSESPDYQRISETAARCRALPKNAT
jgi:uncharacterized protein (DUF1330 family)